MRINPRSFKLKPLALVKLDRPAVLGVDVQLQAAVCGFDVVEELPADAVRACVGGDEDALDVVAAQPDEAQDAGGVLITAGEPLREALLMPGTAFYEEDGLIREAKTAVEGDEEDGAGFAGDEVRVFKVPAKSDGATLLFDPREVDFVESVNRANFASVRGELYPVSMTLDELEAELERFGFFRCHRSYIVNVQKVAKVERFTRNSFNLTLADTHQTQIPLAKGRAEAMRERYGWR